MTIDKRQDSAEADRALLQRVKDCLDQRGYAPLRSLKISVERGVVLVQGRVPTFHLRQIAIGCIKRAVCVTQVVDRIEVVDAPDPCQPSAEDDEERETSEPSLRRRIDLRDMAQSAGGAFGFDLQMPLCCLVVRADVKSHFARVVESHELERFRNCNGNDSQ
jgi:hypothetical protein